MANCDVFSVVVLYACMCACARAQMALLGTRVGKTESATEASSNKVNAVSSTTKALLSQLEGLQHMNTTEIPELDAKVPPPPPLAGIFASYVQFLLQQYNSAFSNRLPHANSS